MSKMKVIQVVHCKKCRQVAAVPAGRPTCTFCGSSNIEDFKGIAEDGQWVKKEKVAWKERNIGHTYPVYNRHNKAFLGLIVCDHEIKTRNYEMRYDCGEVDMDIMMVIYRFRMVNKDGYKFFTIDLESYSSLKEGEFIKKRLFDFLV